jgi:hypothetical protein
MQEEYPILEFDATPEAILEPGQLLKHIDIPEHAVRLLLSRHHHTIITTPCSTSHQTSEK